MVIESAAFKIFLGFVLKGIEIIEKVHSQIRQIESGFTDATENLNFGLVHAVYEWAHGKVSERLSTV